MQTPGPIEAGHGRPTRWRVCRRARMSWRQQDDGA